MELLVTVWRHTGDKPSVSFSHFKLLLAGHRNKKRTGSNAGVYRRPNLPKQIWGPKLCSSLEKTRVQHPAPPIG